MTHREREQKIHRHSQGASRTAKGNCDGGGIAGIWNGMEWKKEWPHFEEEKNTSCYRAKKSSEHWNGRRSGHILRRKKKDKGVLTPAPLPSRRTAHGVGINQNPK
jgi:hypothetical protein